jgi:hypothetical protein
MNITQTIDIVPIENTQAQIVFMRSSLVGQEINASLYEITDNDIKFIGIISTETKIPYATTSGKHVFMVVSEEADFMEAEVDAGKTYYSIITPRMGIRRARFSMMPIKKDDSYKFNTSSDDFKTWQSNTKVAVVTQEAKAWFEQNRENIIEKKEKHWPDWQNKSPQEIAERSLAPEDGL